jgi:hypothetical protein
LTQRPGTQDAIDRLKKALTIKLSLDMGVGYKVFDASGTLTDDVSEEVKGEADTLQTGLTPPFPLNTNRTYTMRPASMAQRESLCIHCRMAVM